MFLSVIIPTRDRGPHLVGMLDSLRAQTYEEGSFEVLVVDNGSADNTREVCESYQRLLPNFQYLHDSQPGLHVGRHLGMKRAKGEILVYADDDIEASPTWLEGIAEAFSDKQVALVGGKNLPKFQLPPPVWIRRMWEKDHHGGRMLPYLSILDLGEEIRVISPYYVFGCNLSIRKPVLLEAGGFHPDAMPLELIRYRGDGETHVARHIIEHDYRAVYNPKASVSHLVSGERMTEEYFCRRAFAQGVSDSYSEIRSGKPPSSRSDFLVPFTRSLLCVLGLGSRLIRFKASYWKGFEYHQMEVRKDRDLFNWVIRGSYIE
jgi:glucosyl-dolichyl phosphate glucuronosyltransferase